MDLRKDVDRMLFFRSCKIAETNYAKDPLDARNLTRWGYVLLQLSSAQQPTDAKKMIQDAISKLEEAIVINPKKADALWTLGNAFTSLAFLFPDADEAGRLFKKSGEYYDKACEEEPENLLYRKSTEIPAKAPKRHAEMHKHNFAQQAAAAGSSTSSNFAQQAAAAGSSTSSSTRTAAKKKSSDLKYDIMGWVILAVGLVAWVVFAKNQMPQALPRPPR